MDDTLNKGGKLRLAVRCVACKGTKEVGPEQRDMPMCERCFMPMVAERARR